MAESHEVRRLAYHPAGHDAELRVAVEEVRTGRWMPMRDLLAHTGDRWVMRTARSQVLASAAARSHVVREWLVEEPGSADALMMRARVEVERALHAFRSGHASVEDLARQARQSALAAARVAPADPVPWVCLLALALTDPAQRIAEHRAAPPELMLAPGPWGVLRQVWQRDPYNREAHHRMLQFMFRSRLGGGSAAGLNFAAWVRSWVPWQSRSALLALPLYAYAEHYRDRRERGRYDAIGRAQWTREPVTDDVERALTGWFEPTDPGERSVLDLNHLAHALWAGRRYAEAAPVFHAVGQFATVQPWAAVAPEAGDPDSGLEEFIRARGQCLALAESSRAGPTSRR